MAKGRRGRPRKTGKRELSGRLQRDGSGPARDYGSEWVQARREKYGAHYNSAIGRAFVAGLLGVDQIAQDRLQAGKKFARAYARFIEQDRYRCPLNDAPRGGWDIEPENALDAQLWLFKAINRITHDADRKYLDELLASRFADNGPYWLDMILAGDKHSVYRSKLACAIAALDAIAPRRKPMGILTAISA
jgi:hypothetical protein